MDFKFSLGFNFGFKQKDKKWKKSKEEIILLNKKDTLAVLRSLNIFSIEMSSAPFFGNVLPFQRSYTRLKTSFRSGLDYCRSFWIVFITWAVVGCFEFFGCCCGLLLIIVDCCVFFWSLWGTVVDYRLFLRLFGSL